MGIDAISGQVDQYTEDKDKHTKETDDFRIESGKLSEVLDMSGNADPAIRDALLAVQRSFDSKEADLGQEADSLEERRKDLSEMVRSELQKIRQASSIMDSLNGRRYTDGLAPARAKASELESLLQEMCSKLGDSSGGGGGSADSVGAGAPSDLYTPPPADRMQKASGGLYSSYADRLSVIPNGSGEWVSGSGTGTRGESMFIPNDAEARRALAACGVKGILYSNCIPDFSPVAEVSVTIGHMTDQRLGKGNNYDQCDTQYAAIWNRQNRGGRSDWSARDVKDYRESNGLTWHERIDLKTCDLVPTSIHAACRHLGGCSEYSRKMAAMTNSGGIFDD